MSGGGAGAPRFASVVLDVDSTLAGIEGIDWLAARRDAAVAQAIARLTERAMDGQVRFDEIYGERLRLIQPTAAEVAALAREYERHVAPGALDAVARLRAAGVRVVVVSGGVRAAILPMARALGLADAAVHAVELRFDAEGCYRGFDHDSPLTTQHGKAVVLERLALPRRILAVGDGSTDVAMADVADAFAAFTGFARRDAVVRAADLELASFDQLTEVVLS